MYTLKKGRDEEGKPALLGPINKRVYASYAPKRHAFAVARREADKRGFTKKSRKKIQIVIDGDEDLATIRTGGQQRITCDVSRRCSQQSCQHDHWTMTLLREMFLKKQDSAG